MLDTSPQLHHSGSLTRRSEELCSLSPPTALRISPADASRLEIAPGQTVEVEANGQSLRLRARIDATIPTGIVSSIWNGTETGVRDIQENDATTTTVVVRRAQ